MNYSDTFNFQSAFKVAPQEGNLVYEYNPFYNYRLDRDMIYYKNRLWDKQEFADELGINYDENSNVFYTDSIESPITDWSQLIPGTENTPVVYQKGQLVDFETDELNLDLKHPVNILPQYSYDNSVNLIINDGINPPRLINSRFSATERNKYQICNRKGNNDSNIYDQGDQFNIDTSLYKKISNIPVLSFSGVGYGGNLSIGNYHFYFRYVDEDDNFSDFFAESGLVSIFIGNSADSIYQGFRNQNSHKLVKFSLSNVDPGYTKVVIYYTRSTSDIDENSQVSAYKIDRKFILSESGSTIITITGYEDVDQVDLSEINPMYQIYGSAETQDAAQNMLFLGNVDRPKLEYEDMADCALRFLPCVDTSKVYNVSQIKSDYTGETTNTYYDPNFIYNSVGYHNDEIYRFGIVFILSDNTLSEVYNVRGVQDIPEDYKEYTHVDFFEKDTKERKYINFDEQYYNIISEDSVNSNLSLENAKGVVSIGNYDFNKIIGIKFVVGTEVIDYLIDTLKIKGFFFVRQKRIPTTLCQAYTIGIDKESKTPVIPYNNKYIAESFLTKYQTKPNSSEESDSSRLLDHNVDDRKYSLVPYEVRNQGAICPEYDINSPYLNTLFTGTSFVCKKVQSLPLIEEDKIHYVLTPPTNHAEEIGQQIKVLGVEDNVKLCAIGDNEFSARAGEAEEAFRYEYIGKEDKVTEASNLIRGSFGPYLGIVGYDNSGDLIDIKIPGYSTANMQEYFKIRYHDKSPFYAISYRYDLSKIDRWASKVNKDYIFDEPLYRGDCYICQFTHRINRNFQDPSSPTNDKIVDPKCWKNHYKVSDGVVKSENFEDINLGDVNAVRLGLYVTLFVRSTYNLNIRALDDSIPDEVSLFGHPRGFYPFLPMSNSGSYKIPEALCFNKGFEKSLSERVNFEVPDVPWIKNEFSNRICYSDIQIKDAFSNGWRTFRGTNYRDYPKTYGSITKLIEFRGNLICVFEHGVALIPVNERAIAGSGSGGNAYINTSNVLPENPKVLSDTFGSQWRESVIKTPRAIYGVDTIGKKIWRTNGESFECISDFKIQEFLNNNISLTERETEPIVGIRNVKTHYNKFKRDVMFTFYDNLHGFEEKVWNVCFNEDLQKWITFYSWVPSYSENIYNQFFSFDRNTSKWISKLGISDYKNPDSDGVTLEDNVIYDNTWESILHLSNRILPEGDGITYDISYELERDNYSNYKLFENPYNTGEVDSEGHSIWKIKLKEGVTYDDLCSEFYKRNSDRSIAKDERGRRIWLNKEEQKNPNRIVILLNIKAIITTSYNGVNVSLGEAYASEYTNKMAIDSGYYQSVVAIIPQYNKQFLTTDFWKHGKAGIIDISDKIYPTYWYGKQHPFEFEFIVADNPQAHKIFDNLQIISNSAEPESFHYEIVGDCYDFAKDKKNMYIRQEATKELYQYNGSDITYDTNYSEIEQGIINSESISEQRNQLNPSVKIDYYHRPYQVDKNNRRVGSLYDKSVILPLYYSRQDSINEIEDFYHLKDGQPTKDFSNLSGGEIVRYDNLDEYRIWSHSKAVDMNDYGRLRGNMQYNEDQWLVQINPLNIVQYNEPQWDSKANDLFQRDNLSNKIPIELGQSPIPSEILEKGDITYDPQNPNNNDIPDTSLDRAIVSWSQNDSKTSEVKLKDKYIKIRIRYSGTKLAIITAIKTLYSISYA